MDGGLGRLRRLAEREGRRGEGGGGRRRDGEDLGGGRGEGAESIEGRGDGEEGWCGMGRAELGLSCCSEFWDSTESNLTAT